MEMGLPDRDSEDAKEGRLLHTYSANKNLDRSTLKPEHQDVLNIADEIDESVFKSAEEQFLPKREEAYDYDQGHEKEIWLLRGNKREIPGHCDTWRYYTNSKLVVISDRKFGRNPVTPADANWQLRTYSVAAADEWKDADNIVVAINQPRLSYFERCTTAFYNREDVEAARAELLSIKYDCEKPNAPLSASEEACRNCRAATALICPAFNQAMQVPAVITPDKALSKAAREAYLEQKLAECTDEQLEQVMLACTLAKMVDSPAKDEARKRIEAGAMPNWSVAKDSEVREVVNVRRAMSLLNLSGLDRSDTYDCVSGLSVTKLEEILRKKHPNWNAKQARDWVDFKLRSVIETQTRKGRIVKK
jgi:hypothetical protein